MKNMIPAASALAFLDLMVLLVAVKACRATKTISGLTIYFTICCLFVYLLGADLEDWIGVNAFGVMTEWPQRGFVWRGGMLIGLIFSVFIQTTSKNVIRE